MKLFWKKNKFLEEKLLPCPRDGKIMKKKQIQDVIIDICPKCKGIWLDDQEIDKLIKYAKQMQKEQTTNNKKNNNKKPNAKRAKTNDKKANKKKTNAKMTKTNKK